MCVLLIFAVERKSVGTFISENVMVYSCSEIRIEREID